MERLPSTRAIRRRLLLEGLAHAVLWGMTAALLTRIPLLLMTFFHPSVFPGAVAPLSGAAVALTCFVWKGCVSRAHLARRLDALGLQNRTGTMLAFENDQSIMAELQRNDTLSVLASVSPASMKIRWPRRLMVLTIILGMTAAGLQTALLLRPTPVVEPDPEYMAIQSLLHSLEMQIDDASLDAATRRALIQQLEAIKEQFSSTDQSMSDVAEASRKAEEMLSMLQQLQKTANIAAEMLRYELLREMGEAMYARDIKAVGVAFDHWTTNLLQGADAVREAARDALIHAIDLTLAAVKDKETGVDEAYLHYTFDTLSMETSRLPIEDFEHPDKGIAIIMETGKARVISVYDSIVVQQGDARTDEDSTDAMASGAMQQFNGEAGQPTGSGGGFGSSLQQGGTDGVQLGVAWQMDEVPSELMYSPSAAVLSGTDGYIPGKVNNDSSVQRLPASEEDYAGMVPYDEIYGAHYAGFLESLMDGHIPESLQHTLETYFLGL